MRAVFEKDSPTQPRRAARLGVVLMETIAGGSLAQRVKLRYSALAVRRRPPPTWTAQPTSETPSRIRGYVPQSIYLSLYCLIL